jgi:FixJ family two-component response regulator
MNSREFPPAGTGRQRATNAETEARGEATVVGTNPLQPASVAAAPASSTEEAAQQPVVFVVDDDPALLRLIRKLLEATGRRVETFTSATEFLEACRSHQAGCLVLDVRMPGMSGLVLQERLARDEISLPILIVTGYGDVPVAVQAMRQGAFDFIEKPFSGQILIDRIEAALVEDQRRRQTRTTLEEVRRRRATLTPRERQVMDLVVDGKPNKIVGADLHLSPKTVEVHRANVMKKMEAGSLAELVRMALLIGAKPKEATA